MRVLALIFLSGLLSYSALSGQTTLTIKAQFGQAWQGTTNFFFLDDNDYPRLAHYGLSAEFFRAVTPKFSLGVAPGYMRRGSELEVGFINGLFVGPIPSFDSRLHLNYFQLPLLAKYETALFQRFSISGQIGAGFAYLLGGYREVKFFGSNVDRERQNLDFDGLDDDLNRFDFGLYSGIAVGYALKQGKLLLSFDHYHGSFDVDQKVVSENRNWGIGLGYQLPLNQAK